MADLIDRQTAIDAVNSLTYPSSLVDVKRKLVGLPSVDAVEVVRCKDCVFGHLYVDVINGVTDSWIECRNPEGLNRDVSVDGYCSASIRRM